MEIVIIIVLILLNGVLSMSEIALVSARKTKLETEAKKGNRGARKALDLAEEPDRFLSTIQIGITLIGILTGLYSGEALAGDLAVYFSAVPYIAPYALLISKSLIVVLVTYLTLIFGELVPKRIGMGCAERVSMLIARPMHLLSLIASPFVWLLSKSTAVVVKMLGIDTAEDSKVTEEEIKSMIQEGTEDGEVQPVEQDIMQRVFLLGDLKVGSIMTHKNEIAWLDTSMTSEDVRGVLSKQMYEFYPIAEGDLDHVKGVVDLKDLILHLHEPNFNLKSLTREPVYFHENMNVYKALEQMKAQKISRALVCDEFGTCMGIITLRDILEGLVGSMEDAGEEPDIIKRVNKDGWLVDGQCPLYDFLCYFDRQELLENVDYHTVGGLILNDLQHVPQSGETMEWNGFAFEVVDMDGARIDKVLVTIPSTSKEEDEK